MIVHKPIRVGNFWNNNYIEYESSSGRNENLSVKEYFEYFVNFQKSNTWTFQLTIAINFTSSKDVDEERVMHSKSFNELLSHFFQDNKLV